MKGHQEIYIIENNQLEESRDQRLYPSNLEGFSHDKNLCNSGDATQLPEGIISGEWRTNIMLEDAQTVRSDRALALRHLTSFEEKSMEDHGSRLKSTLQNYSRFINKRLCPQNFELDSKMTQKALSWEETEQALSLISNLNQDKKNFLINFSKRNSEAQLVLRQIFSHIPAAQLAECLTITSHLIEDYQGSNVESMDEDEVETYVSLNYSKVAENAKQDLIGSPLLPTDFEADHEYEELIASWMETIYLALNGVFECPDNRKSSLADFQGYETFHTSRKLVKID